jgi:hypothetical protein
VAYPQKRKSPVPLCSHVFWVLLEGFGWHALRREAVTAFNAALGVTQTMKMSGHAMIDMSAHHTFADQVAQDGAVRARQESIIGNAGEKVN